MPARDATCGRHARVRSPALTAFAAAILVACFALPAEASRAGEDQEEEARPEARPVPDAFSGVQDNIEQKLVAAASNLVQSSQAQAALTKTVSDNIGQYNEHVKNIASTMGDVLKARQDLTQAYHEDIDRGEASRIGPLQVEIPELSQLAEEIDLPSNSAFSTSSGTGGAQSTDRLFEEDRSRLTAHSSSQQQASTRDQNNRIGEVPADSDLLPTTASRRPAAMDEWPGDSDSAPTTASRPITASRPSAASTRAGSQPTVLEDHSGDGLDSDILEFGDDIDNIQPNARSPNALLSLGQSEKLSKHQPAALPPAGDDDLEDQVESDYQEPLAPPRSARSDDAAAEQDFADDEQIDSQEPSETGSSSFISEAERDAGVDDNGWSADTLPQHERRDFESDEEPEPMPRPLRKSSLVHLQTNVGHRTAVKHSARSHLQQLRNLRRSRAWPVLHKSQQQVHHQAHAATNARHHAVRSTEPQVASRSHSARAEHVPRSWAAHAAHRARHQRRHQRIRLARNTHVGANAASSTLPNQAPKHYRNREREIVHKAARRHSTESETNAHHSRLPRLDHRHRHREAAVAVHPRSFEFDRRFN